MGAIDKLDAYQGGLSAKELGVDFIQLIPAQIIIAIAGCAGKVSLSYSMILKCLQYPLCVLLGNGVNTCKLLSKFLLCPVPQGPDFLTNL